MALSEEVCLPCKAISCLTKANDQTIIQELFDTVVHATIVDIVNESIGENEYDVPLSHIFTQEFLCRLWIVT